MNPFRYGEVVTGEDFCSRPDLMKRLRQHLSEGRNTVLLGERRVGKTSLIFESARRIRGLRLIYAQLWAVKSIDDIAGRLLRAIMTMQSNQSSFLQRVARTLSHLRPRIDFDPTSGQPSITVMPGAKLTPEGLHGVFDFIEDLSRQQRLAVALDEFQDVRNLKEGDAVLGEIRGRIQRQSRVPYVFAGSIRHEMEKIFRDPSSPFFKSLQVLEVEYLPRTRFTKFLEERFSSGRRKMVGSSYEEVFRISQDNPSDVQQFCAAIWETTRAGETIDTNELQRALRHIFATERKGYEAQVKNLTGNQTQCLRALARLGGERPQSKEFLRESGISLPASVRRSLVRLEHLEILAAAERGYDFFDPFFRQWVIHELQ